MTNAFYFYFQLGRKRQINSFFDYFITIYGAVQLVFNLPNFFSIRIIIWTFAPVNKEVEKYSENNFLSLRINLKTQIWDFDILEMNFSSKS